MTPYTYNDTVFAVKDDLVVKFTPRDNDPKAELDLHFDMCLESLNEASRL